MLLAVMIAIDSKAQATYIVDGIKYYTNFESQTAYVTCKFPIPAYKGDIIIASTVAGLPVVGIDEQAFADCDEVTSVLLPETIQWKGQTRCYLRLIQYCGRVPLAGIQTEMARRLFPVLDNIGLHPLHAPRLELLLYPQR